MAAALEFNPSEWIALQQSCDRNCGEAHHRSYCAGLDAREGHGSVAPSSNLAISPVISSIWCGSSVKDRQPFGVVSLCPWLEYGDFDKSIRPPILDGCGCRPGWQPTFRSNARFRPMTGMSSSHPTTSSAQRDACALPCSIRLRRELQS